uniref:UBZ1-type domain-containing protein n=1 Tax=Amphiprion ocellaris TaxID=80972 RepID=A0AAQ5XQW1_AMPOC
MEDAYNELYQQFLCLRSLCLRQASLLHQLTAALQKQQGLDMMSIPVQCTREVPVYPLEKPQLLTAATQNPAAQGIILVDTGLWAQQWLSIFNNPSCVHMYSSVFLLCPSLTSSSSPVCLRQAPLTNSPSLAADSMSQPGGPLMSDVALQSHVCEFCQAVFPGDTTTRGEFLRHLYTHVT